MEATSPKIPQCPQCLISFKTIKVLNTHLKTHDKNAFVNCKICGKSLKNRVALHRHMRFTHSNKAKPKCKICSVEFVRPENLRGHMANVHSTEARPRHPCSVVGCGKTFLYNHGLSRHFGTEHAENPVRFCCTLCSKEYTTKLNLEAHIAAHTGEKSYKCDTCGMIFVTHYRLKAHQEVHREKSKRKVYKCELCPSTFLSKMGISRHVRTIHGDRNYLCTHCNKKYNRLSGLRYHILTKHKTEDMPSYSCEECEYKTVVKTNLKLHIKRVHEGDHLNSKEVFSKRANNMTTSLVPTQVFWVSVVAQK
ncbi:Zinc finger protein 77 [Folsomia candida]|uniref:Zinc finger protein 77 n=1 Tax=Folsomia candida TaxID=158441 RepID=A0A226DBQ5_FOLCA|nr:Zinc finger protein 77 [Folsomia candida]